MDKHAYFSTFLAGGGEIMADFLQEDLFQVEIESRFDGLVSYSTPEDLTRIITLKHFNNSYLQVEKFAARSFDQFTDQVLKYLRIHGERLWKTLVQAAGDRPANYRIMFYNQNQPAGVTESALTAMEKYISGGQLVDRTHPGMEITAMWRREEVGLLGVKLTYHPDYKKILKPGELRPEIAYILCRLSRPGVEDVFLDPFAGYGSIPAARWENWPAGKILCSDIDQNKINHLKRRFGGKEIIRIRLADATKMSWLSDKSITRIVTDPPWGDYDRFVDPRELYKLMAAEFDRIITDGGEVVILTAARRELEEAFGSRERLQVKKKWNVLVSGRQAAIYLLEAGRC